LPKIDPGFAAEELSRAQAGAPAAFAGLVRAHQRLVYSIALRMLADAALAEDLAQEVFLQLHRSLGSIQSAAHLVFWLRRVTAHRAIDRLRRRPRVSWAPLAAAEQLPAAERPADPLLSTRLEALVAELAPLPRAVLLLRYQEDLDPGDIARTLDISVNTVKSHLRRTLAELRLRLATGVPPARGGES
jgi:RNA polymerase sigma-70 factor, ECF subfamily